LANYFLVLLLWFQNFCCGQIPAGFGIKNHSFDFGLVYCDKCIRLPMSSSPIEKHSAPRNLSAALAPGPPVGSVGGMVVAWWAASVRTPAASDYPREYGECAVP